MNYRSDNIAAIVHAGGLPDVMLGIYQWQLGIRYSGAAQMATGIAPDPEAEAWDRLIMFARDPCGHLRR